MAKRKTTQTPKTDWQEVTVRQRTLLADTSTAVFDLEMSLTGLNDAFPHIDEDTLSSMINMLARACSDIQNRIDLHLAYMPTPEDE
jgi:hypothetical protein